MKWVLQSSCEFPFRYFKPKQWKWGILELSYCLIKIANAYIKIRKINSDRVWSQGAALSYCRLSFTLLLSPALGGRLPVTDRTGPFPLSYNSASYIISMPGPTLSGKWAPWSAPLSTETRCFLKENWESLWPCPSSSAKGLVGFVRGPFTYFFSYG